MTDVPSPGGDAAPAAGAAATGAAGPSLPDLSDLIANPGKPPRAPNPRARLYGGAVVAGLVLAGGGFGIGYALAPGGPSTLVEAVQEAQSGQLPCGSPPAGTGTGTATGTGAGAGFVVARLCQRGGFGTGTGPGGTGTGTGGGGGGFGGRGGGFGGLFGPGSVNGSIMAVSAGSITLQTRGGAVTIALPAAARVTKTTTGSVKDLSPGETVVVSTTSDSSGNRTATSVFVLPAGTGGQAG